MKRIHFCLSIGFANASRNEIVEFDDDATDEEIQRAYDEWCSNYMEGGWWPEDDE